MRRPNPDDFGLWRRAMRDVKPLADRPPAPTDRPGAARGRADVTGALPSAPTRLPPGPAASPPPLDRFAGVDRATAERLKRGRTQIEARLDLHGMTQAEAHRALVGFVPRSRAAGRRCVLIITGHGRNHGGVLKTAVPRWLAEPGLRQHLLGISPARPPHGGDGALYLLLRRLRS